MSIVSFSIFFCISIVFGHVMSDRTFDTFETLTVMLQGLVLVQCGALATSAILFGSNVRPLGGYWKTNKICERRKGK